ncbi:flavin-containing amine oxidasedehydrogenase [Rhizoctonia solani AG-1 IA]|uniref:Flavin-containing amine oxidasedehydrogenase n=1 Tax=Thanatephorus cucumeris (strain AG1-IA) TaxID=983506 RepID=L8WR15_THACA|nr:flavin-containing amine oxidasedehydrogenase [Rhizoctonia solani AG-1 IA]
MKTRVCIVGAGAAGMSCAYALSKHTEKYEVTIFDKQTEAGGMATSISIDAERYGASYINDGVQGCSPAFANTIKMFKLLGYECTEVGMQISFGTGPNFWSNVFPSPLVRSFESDIAKFGRALKTIKRLEPIFAFIPIQRMLSLFRFSPSFGERMVYPLAALFFGTGNQTPYVSSAILARVFLDPSMRLFEFDDRSLLASIPTMFAFPRLGDVYRAWQQGIEKTGATFKLGHEVKNVVQRKDSSKGGVVVEYAKGDAEELESETFDELVMATDADAALKILGKSATWMERQVLADILPRYDITITHNDLDYMNKHYETKFKDSLAADPQPEHAKDDQDAIELGRKEFKPLYYTKQYEDDKRKIEMSFGESRQYKRSLRVLPVHQEIKGWIVSFQNSTFRKGLMAETSMLDIPHDEKPMEQHVFQTIFLDRDSSEGMWTWNEIPKEKRIYEKWWKQQSHRWQHYAKVVPWMMFINGKNHTHFAGAWSVLNMHELAVTSGFAAAYRLGADFPFRGDDDCERLFKLYLALSHGTRAVSTLLYQNRAKLIIGHTEERRSQRVLRIGVL